MDKNMSTAKRIDWKGHGYTVYRDSTVFKRQAAVGTCVFCKKIDTLILVITFRQYGLWRDVVVQLCQCKSCKQRLAIRTFETMPETIVGKLEVIDANGVGKPVESDGWLPRSGGNE